MSREVVNEDMDRVQGLMVYLGSIAHGLEMILGRGSGSVATRAGKKVGTEWKVSRKAPGDLNESLAIVQEEMRNMGINWPFAPYKRSTEESLTSVTKTGETEVKIVTQNCMVRCTLLRYGFPQKGSLCLTKHALFCGLFDQAYGCRSRMGITHAGENGCLLNLYIQEK
ncbi:MAG: hypothetical protein H6729_01870 [Deltaproteobacteria bacterium]|nr:hypothetical protein [Deltaproteobacteria bacterium]